MPYSNNTALPSGVKDALPSAAQSIFRRAFNATESSHSDYSEERLFRIAWGAVKNAGYKKTGEKWVKESFSVSAKVIDKSWSNGVYTLSSLIPRDEINEEQIFEHYWEAESPYIVSGISKTPHGYLFEFILMKENMIYEVDEPIKICVKMSLTLDSV
jgi:cation transport regulator